MFIGTNKQTVCIYVNRLKHTLLTLGGIGMGPTLVIGTLGLGDLALSASRFLCFWNAQDGFVSKLSLV